MNVLINNKDIRKTKKVYIEWIDSTAIRGWNHKSALNDDLAEPSKICSVGYLVLDQPNYVLISTSLSANGSIMDPLSIPKCAIIKQHTIK